MIYNSISFAENMDFYKYRLAIYQTCHVCCHPWKEQCPLLQVGYTFQYSEWRPGHLVQHCTQYCRQCVIPGNIHTHPREGLLEILRAKVSKAISVNQNWNFQQNRWGRGDKTRNTLHGRARIFSRTKQTAQGPFSWLTFVICITI